MKFDSPADAAKALRDAAKNKDRAAMLKIFGPASSELCSGDDVQDASDMREFSRSVAARVVPVETDATHVTLHIGWDDFPFAIPLVKQSDGKWIFDTQAGKDEIINRRVGENELTAIGVCRAYVEAQREYASVDRNANDVMEYAQRFKSTPGKKDGLVWQSSQGEPLSPMGPLIAQAHAEGYGHRGATDENPRPFHGYLFKVLTKQGEHAAGGKMDYVINGHMVAGFALVAYPVEWGKSGVMTFVVNSNGKVYQKNLGEKTQELVAAMDTYDPDKTWQLVTEEPQ